MANRVVFLDRDGTMAKDVPYCSRVEDFELFSTTAQAIRLLNRNSFKVIVVTNQSGIARGYFSEETLGKIHEKMRLELAREGARVDAVYYCPHHPDDNCECRKPKPGLVLQAVKEHNINLRESFVVGDLENDIGLGKAVGCHTVLIGTDRTLAADAVASDLMKAAHKILTWGGKAK